MSMSKAWIAAAEVPVDANGKPQGNGSVMPFVVGLVAMVIVAGMMRHVFAMSGLTTIGGGMMGGAGIGAFLITPWVAMNYAGMRKPALTLIDGAAWSATIAGAVLNRSDRAAGGSPPCAGSIRARENGRRK
jgi:hypothetical protein